MGKLKNRIVLDEPDRWSVSLRQSTRNGVDAYLAKFRKDNELPVEKVGRSEIIEMMLRQFMTEDRDFMLAYPDAKKLAD